METRFAMYLWKSSLAFLGGSVIVLMGCARRPELSPNESHPPSNQSASKTIFSQRDDWPGFLGPWGTGVAPGSLGRANWAQGLPLLWELRLGEGYAAPSISENRIYVFDRWGNQARLCCRDLSSSAEIWRFEYSTDFTDRYGYDGGPRCCPVLDDTHVIIHGPEGMLHCLQKDNGSLLWKVDTRSSYGVVQNFFGVGSTPIIDGSNCIVAVGGSPAGDEPEDFRQLPANGTAIVVLDIKTGKERYHLGDDLASYSSPRIVSFGNERRGIYWARHQLLIFDPLTGRLESRFRWRSDKLESVNAANPVVVDDTIFLSESYGVGSVLLRRVGDRLQVIWQDDAQSRRKSLECHWNTPMAHQGHLFGCSGRHSSEAEIRCVELATGKVKWRQPFPGRASLMKVEDQFLVLGEYGLLTRIRANTETYDEIDRIDLGSSGRKLLRYPCWAAPVLCRGHLLLRGEGRLICLNVAN